ncbi:MAG: hypothetical protein WCH58_00935 [Candidatus Saccharibacteria bacterium]
MKIILNLISIALYLAVGVISFKMAINNLFAKEYLGFHKKATKKSWAEVDQSMQYVIIFLMRLTGLGFLMTAILLIVFPIVNLFAPSFVGTFLTPLVALVFCFGLFVSNYSLYKKSSANTPWHASLIASGLILFGLLLSIISNIVY